MATAKAIKDTAAAAGTTGVIVGGAKAAAPAQEPAVDLIKTTKDVVTEISSWKAITNAMSDAFAYATSHWWIFVVVVAFALWKWGGKIELSRLKDHNLGFNLGR